jgi:hypothetical protein
MKKFIPQCRQILSSSRKADLWKVRRFDYSAATFTCALLWLLLLSATGVAQVQSQAQLSPDPLTITSNGNVGVGTTAPTNKLSVAGNADFSGNVGVGTTTPANKLSVVGNADFSGNVGVGTVTPANKLSVAGNADFSGNVGIGTNSLGTSKFRIANSSGDFAHFRFDATGGGEFEFVGWANGWNINSKTAGKNLYLNRDANTNSDVLIGHFGKEMIVKGDTGNVGIGTPTPTKGKVEIQGSASGDYRGTNSAYLGTQFTQRIPGGLFSVPAVVIPGNIDPPPTFSLYASDSIAAQTVFAFSDARLKHNQGRSDALRDLATLMAIEVTDYSYIDSVSKGTGMQKKVTGQQVEKVFPQAVLKTTDVVPDIYQKATMKDGWVMLATNLKKGERVRLISEKAAGVYEVLEVAKDKFRADFKPEGDRVFVFGREVNDYRTVDYDAIAMLNVSATQQIKKEKDAEVTALRDENAALRSQLAAQEKRLSELEASAKARDEKLAAIDALLLSGDKPAPAPRR